MRRLSSWHRPPGARSAGGPGRVDAGRTGRDIVAQITLRAMNLALGVLTTAIVVRTLGEDGYGQWATLFALLSLAGTFGLRGLSTVSVERAAAEPGRADAWLGGLLTLRFALGLPIAVISLVLSLIIADTPEMRVAAVVIHTILITSSLGVLRVAFQLQVRNATVSAVELANGIVWCAVAAVIAALDGGLVELAIAFAVVAHAMNLTLFVLALRAHPVRLSGARSLWGPLIRLGLPVSLASVIALGYGRIDQVLVFELAGADDAGLYGAVYRIYDRLQVFPSSLMTTLFPLLVAARRDDLARLRRLLAVSIDYLLLVSAPALAVTLVGAPAIVTLLFGPEFEEAAGALRILMAAFVVVSLGHLSGYLIITYRLQRQFVVIALVALALNVGANFVFVPDHGFLAAAWITLGTELFVLVTSTWIVFRHAGLVPRGRRLGRVAVAAVVTGLAAWGLDAIGVPLLVWLPIAGLVYAGVLLGIGAVRLDELRALLRRSPLEEA